MPKIRLPHAVRALLSTPLVTLIAVVSLALGIGANAAIFSMFDQMLLRPLPVPDPGTLVNLSAPGPKPGSQSCGQAGDCDDVFSYPMFRDLERAQTSFVGIAAHRPFSVNLAFRGQTLNGSGLLVSGSYFPVLGLQPALGRLFSRADDGVTGEPHVVVLSYDYWRTRFDSRADALNQPLIVNGQPMTIVGVAPRGFESTILGVRPQVFVPMTMRDIMESYFKGSLENRRWYWAYVFGRLEPGVGLDQALAAVNVRYSAIINDVEAPLQKEMSQQTMKRFRARKLTGVVDPRGQSSLHREARTPLILLFSVTGLVLLIACANIANLLLARAAGRSSEMAIRLAIGASRWQVVRQLLTEAGLLAVAGGALGILVAKWTLDLIAGTLTSRLAATMAFTLDGRVMLFAAGIAIGTGLLFGLFPALHATRPDLVTALKSQSGQPGGSRTAARFRTTLVTAQVGLSMLLLVGAGLFIKSLVNVSRVDLGLRTENVVTFAVSPQLNGYTGSRSLELFQRMEDELGKVPGVTSVTAALVPPLSGDNWASSLEVEGFPSGPDTDTQASFNKIGPGYFRTFGVPLLAGREFTTTDAAGSPRVAIVNEAFTRKFKLGRQAVGKHIQEGPRDSPQIEIVGVVADSKYSDVKDAPPPQYFEPYRQGDTLGFLNFYVKTTLPPERLLATIPKVVARLDPNLPVEDPRTMAQQIRDNTFVDRLLTTFSASFALLATLLAAIGLYGVLAYTVAQRTREIGLRMALGAAPDRVRRMILTQTAVMTAIGGVAGLALAALAGRYAQSLLYQLQGYDPTVFVTAAVVLGSVALAAGLVPAIRASQVDPMAALRNE
jgi:putative ABC transport system permease protein